MRLEYDADGTIRFGPARRRTVEGIHVLELHGGPYDMARQHGALLADRHDAAQHDVVDQVRVEIVAVAHGLRGWCEGSEGGHR